MSATDKPVMQPMAIAPRDGTEVHGVLVLPAPGDPLGLLAPGLCNAAPPCVALGRCGSKHCDNRQWLVPSYPLFLRCSCSTDQGSVWMHVTTSTRALPLWWKGQIVPEGMDRFYRAHGRAPHHLKDLTVQDVLTAAMVVTLSGDERVIPVDSQGRPLDLEAAPAR